MFQREQKVREFAESFAVCATVLLMPVLFYFYLTFAMTMMGWDEKKQSSVDCIKLLPHSNSEDAWVNPDPGVCV